jgi:uncharacterized protein (TIGR02646 family)
MRHVHKATEPEPLRGWKAATPDASWDGMPTPIKQETKRAILRDQLHLCCYCEGPLSPGMDVHSPPHIEHIVARADPVNGLRLSVEWNNLLASCTPSEVQQRLGAHCGERKANRRIPINPVQEDCASHFFYKRGGDVAGIGPCVADAEKTISTLGLNERTLKGSREAACQAFAARLGVGEDLSKFFEAGEGGALPAYYSALQATLRRLT